MRARIIRFAGIGFLIGMVMGNLIAWLFRSPGADFVSPALAGRMGGVNGAIAVQTLVSGLYGGITVCGMLLYEIDQWPLAQATAVHYLIVAALYAAMALFLGWAERPEDLLPVEGIMLAAYCLIWLIMCLRYKAQVRKLNELLKKNSEKRKLSGK